MRTVVVGLGVQGVKRLSIAGEDIVATVDPAVSTARYRTLEQVPVDTYDAALVCTPDSIKLEMLTYLLAHGKHVLVEKPLLVSDNEQIHQLIDTAGATGAACYTAYNHRFEPHIVGIKRLLDDGVLGKVYVARFFYGNGTAQDIKSSPWRDDGLGILGDLGSHLLDMALFLFGPRRDMFEAWSTNRFETRSFDHVLFGSHGTPLMELEVTCLSWKNTFSVDLWGELGSAHISGLCKWGPSTLTVRRRVFPSGVPAEETETLNCADPTWALEYEYFKSVCETGETNLENDLWINSTLSGIAQTAEVKLS
jgi:predicted dehydrogenase